VDWAERGAGEKIQDSGIQGYKDTDTHAQRYWILDTGAGHLDGG